MYLYGTLFVVLHTQGTLAWITQFNLQLHQYLPLPRKRSPDGASTHWGCRPLIAAYYVCCCVSLQYFFKWCSYFYCLWWNGELSIYYGY